MENLEELLIFQFISSFLFYTLKQINKFTQYFEVKKKVDEYWKLI